MDQQRRHGLLDEPSGLQNVDSRPLHPAIWHQQIISLYHSADDVLRLWLSLRQSLHSNLRLLSALQILEPRHAWPLHKLYKSWSGLWSHEYRLGSFYLRSPPTGTLGLEALVEGKGFDIFHLYERGNVSVRLSPLCEPY